MNPGDTIKMSDRTYIVDRNGCLRVDSYQSEDTRALPEFVENTFEPGLNPTEQGKDSIGE